MLKSLTAVALALATVAFAPAYAADTKGDIVAVAASAGQFKTLLAAATAAGLAPTLPAPGPSPVFPPPRPFPRGRPVPRPLPPPGRGTFSASGGAWFPPCWLTPMPAAHRFWPWAPARTGRCQGPCAPA